VRKTGVWIGIAVTALAASVAAASAASSAEPVKVNGLQIVVDEKKGLYEMKGSLVGAWAITSFTPRYQSSSEFAGTGTERFRGCHDLDRSGVCDAGEPTGSIRFTFMYWASFDPKSGNLVKGQCVHPVTGGTGAFAGAKGLIVMHDRPTKTGIRTTYSGSLRYPASAKSATAEPTRALASSGAARSCGS
jgi:hypothetical protein